MKSKLLFLTFLVFATLGFSSMTVAKGCQGCHVVQASFEERSVEFVQEVMPVEEEKPGWMNWMLIAFSFIVAGANAITASLPSTMQGSAWYNMLMKLLNFLSMNFGNNKNSDDKPIEEANRPPASLK